jgi:4-hydroxy-tetrahydrodipicolinate reductase
MSVKIIINGAYGKMGSLLSEALMQTRDYHLLARCGRQDDLAAIIRQKKPDVVVELTSAEAVYANAKTIIEQGVKPLIGSSGLTLAQIEELEKISQEKKLGGIIAPNFSLGAILLMKYAEEIAHYYPQVEIIEMHHDYKKDAPSGTALKTAEMLAKTHCKTAPAVQSKESIAGATGCRHQNIAIHSLRLPGFIARQDVIFADQGETLSISHNLIDRKAMLPGMMLSLKKIQHLDHLVYGLENLI